MFLLFQVVLLSLMFVQVSDQFGLNDIKTSWDWLLIDSWDWLLIDSWDWLLIDSWDWVLIDSCNGESWRFGYITYNTLWFLDAADVLLSGPRFEAEPGEQHGVGTVTGAGRTLQTLTERRRNEDVSHSYSSVPSFGPETQLRDMKRNKLFPLLLLKNSTGRNEASLPRDRKCPQTSQSGSWEEPPRLRATRPLPSGVPHWTCGPVDHVTLHTSWCPHVMTDGQTDGRTDGQTDRWTCGLMDRLTDRCFKPASLNEQAARFNQLDSCKGETKHNRKCLCVSALSRASDHRLHRGDVRMKSELTSAPPPAPLQTSGSQTCSVSFQEWTWPDLQLQPRLEERRS